jgi:hypothetical protein
MSYSSFVNDLEPYFYFPMNVFDQNIPVDFEEKESALIFGDYGIEESEKFFSNQLKLFPGAYFILSESSEFNSAAFTYSFWVGSQAFDSPEIFSLHNSQDGFGISYLNESEEVVLTVYSDSSYAIPFKISEPVLISLVLSGNDLFVYLNDSLAYTYSSINIPAEPEVTLGTLSGLDGQGELSVSDFFYIKQALSGQQISTLYLLGFEGYETLEIKEASPLSILEGNKTFFQTAWQSYGEVTTKR